MEPLTQCEYQVANEVAKGHTPVEIADVLQKSVWTIKAQIRDIHKKLGINSYFDMRRIRFSSRARNTISVRITGSRNVDLSLSNFLLS